MYEGKNIHFSQVDRKPLCSYSSRLCKQRRLNGYAFCIRHILEDPTAPFKPCAFTANNSKNNHQCTQPVPQKDSRLYCNHHMQTLGLAKKPEAKQRPARQADKSKSNHKVTKEIKVKDVIQDNRTAFEDRLKSKFNLHRKENGPSHDDPEDPYAFPEPPSVSQLSSSNPSRSEKSSPTKVKSSPSLMVPMSPSGDAPTGPNHVKTSPKVAPPMDLAGSLFSSTPIAQRYPELAEKLEKARVKPEVKLKADSKTPNKNSSSSSSTVQRSSRTMNRLQTKIAQNKIKDKLKKTQDSIGSSDGVTASSPSSSCNSMNSMPSLPTESKCTLENGLRFEPLTCSVDPVDKGRELSSHVSPYPGSLPPHSINHIPLTTTLSAVSSLQQHLLSLPHFTASMGSSSSKNSSTTPSLSSSIAHTRASNHPTSTPQAQAVLPGALSINPTLSLFTVPLTNALEQLNPQAFSRNNEQPRPSVAIQQPNHLHPSNPSKTNQLPFSALNVFSAAAPGLASSQPPASKESTCTVHKGTALAAAAAVSSVSPPSVLPSPTLASASPPRAKSEVRQCLRTQSALQYYSHCMRHKQRNAELLPPVVLDTDDSDCEDESPWQQEWFYPPLEEVKISRDEHYLCSARMTKLSLLRSQCRRQLMQLRRSQHDNTVGRKDHHSTLGVLLRCVKNNQEAAYKVVNCTRATNGETLENNWCHSPARKQQCVHRENRQEKRCLTDALPFANHCIKHIMYNSDQQLYDLCTAKFSDNTQCSVPVYDIRHELPLCREHAAKFDNYNKKPEVKPKKPRKKTKPSALTRPPKKGKKKKNQKRNVRPQKPMPPLEPTGNTVYSNMPPSIKLEESQDNKSSSVSNHGNASGAVTTTTEEEEDDEEEEMEMEVSTTTMNTSTDTVMETNDIHPDPEPDLGPMSPGTIDRSLELPLDSELATKFLDEHDLHDVLKRLPDEAFDIFTGKNGEFEESQVLDIGCVQDSLQELDAETLGQLMGGNNTEDELTKQIAASIFNQGLGSPGHLDDDDGDLNQGDNLQDLANISTAELKTISQTLSTGIPTSLNNHAISSHGATILHIQDQHIHVSQAPHMGQGHHGLHSQIMGQGQVMGHQNQVLSQGLQHQSHLQEHLNGIGQGDHAARVSQQSAVSLIAAQLAQGTLGSSGHLTTIHMPGNIAALGGAALTIGPQGALVSSLDGTTHHRHHPTQVPQLHQHQHSHHHHHPFQVNGSSGSVLSSGQPHSHSHHLISTTTTTSDTGSNLRNSAAIAATVGTTHLGGSSLTLNSGGWGDSSVTAHSFSSHTLPSINTLPIMQTAGGNSTATSIKVAYPLQLLQGDLAHLLGGSGTLEQALMGGVQSAGNVASNLSLVTASSSPLGSGTPNVKK